MNSRFEEMRQQCADFHKANPEVWDHFVLFTNQIISKGFANYSVKAIFERIRWEMDAKSTGESQFKINNNFSAFYGRRFMKMYPQHAGFFRTREQISESLDPTNLPPLTPSHFGDSDVHRRQQQQY
jgi:hypothetical protein